MARVLRNLRISDVSSVDVGAGRGVKVVLTKRHLPGALYKAFGDAIDAEAEAYLKREFTQDQRDAAAESGAALPDGSYPIHNKSDLKNAIQAIGRAKDPAKAKAHIRARAKDLGATDMLPESWSKRAPLADVLAAIEKQIAKGSVDFEEAQSMIEGAEAAGCLMNEIREAMCALDCSIRSILEDDDVTDKAKAIADSYEQFKDHLADLDIEDDDDLEKTDMTTVASPQVQKMIDEAVAAAVAKAASDKEAEIAKLAGELAVAKMSEKHKAYHDSLSGDAQKKFAAMSPEDRDAEMEKTRKRAEDDPIYKRMQGENEELRKRLTAIEDERALDIAKRDAKEMGLTPEDAGVVLMKMRRGDQEAIKKFEKYMLELAKSKTAIERSGKIFAEFGTANTSATGVSAQDELTAKAAELRTKQPDLTEAQAFDKVYNDPANRELRAREQSERMSKIHRVA